MQVQVSPQARQKRRLLQRLGRQDGPIAAVAQLPHNLINDHLRCGSGSAGLSNRVRTELLGGLGD
jgi:hypothetical protein